MAISFTCGIYDLFLATSKAMPLRGPNWIHQCSLTFGEITRTRVGEERMCGRTEEARKMDGKGGEERRGEERRGEKRQL